MNGITQFTGKRRDFARTDDPHWPFWHRQQIYLFESWNVVNLLRQSEIRECFRDYPRPLHNTMISIQVKMGRARRAVCQLFTSGSRRLRSRWWSHWRSSCLPFRSPHSEFGWSISRGPASNHVLLEVLVSLLLLFWQVTLNRCRCSV